MVERDAPRPGQDHPSEAPFEQIMPERGPERADLRRERRLREVQPPGGRRQHAIARDDMTEAQVAAVRDEHFQSFHLMERNHLSLELFSVRHGGTSASATSPEDDRDGMIPEPAAALGAQAQKPTLAFLIGVMVLAALSSRPEVPEADLAALAAPRSRRR